MKKFKFLGREEYVVFEISEGRFKAIIVDKKEIIDCFVHDIDPCDKFKIKLDEWLKIHFKGENIPFICSFPLDSVTVKFIDLPSSDINEIKDMIDLQISKFTPYTKQEVMVDFRILEMSNGVSSIMLVIVQKSAIRELFYLLENIGIDVSVTTSAIDGLLAWYELYPDKKGINCIVDIDGGYSKLLVFRNSKPVFFRTIRIGILNFREDKNSSIEQFIRQMRQSLEACLPFAGEMPRKILFTGCLNFIEEIKEGFKKAGINIEVEKASLTLSSRINIDEENFKKGFSFISLAGIAVLPEFISVNLIPETVAMKKQLLARSKMVSSTAILVIMAMLSISFAVSTRYCLTLNKLSNFRRIISHYKPQVDELENMIRQIDFISKYIKDNQDAVRVLCSIIDSLPSDVNIESLNYDRDKGDVNITGSASDRATVSAFVQALEKSVAFAGVKAESIKRDSKTGRYLFLIVSKLED